MAQGDPPVYQLVDSNGNVQAEIRHDLAQSLIIDQLNGSDIDFQQSDLSNIASVSTDDGSIGGDPLLGGPASSSDAGLTLGSGFTVFNPDSPSFLTLRLTVETDGSTNGQVRVEIDESGGSTADRIATIGFAPKVWGTGAQHRVTDTIYVPAGASVSVSNDQDPTANNSLDYNRFYEL